MERRTVMLIREDFVQLVERVKYVAAMLNMRADRVDYSGLNCEEEDLDKARIHLEWTEHGHYREDDEDCSSSFPVPLLWASDEELAAECDRLAAQKKYDDEMSRWRWQQHTITSELERLKAMTPATKIQELEAKLATLKLTKPVKPE